MSNPQPSRLSPGNKSLWFISQTGPEASFADIFGHYTGFLKWCGFYDNRLVRANSTGQGGATDVDLAHLN